MRTVGTKAELRAALSEPRRSGARIGLVPTMGHLHDGHLSLVRAARRECDVVVLSLFVNPAQFGPDEDLDRYPRDEARDGSLAESEGVDLLYAPTVEEVYPQGFATTVEVDESLTAVLCGEPSRRGPEHFRGVATIVAKLFNSIQPDVAYFGQKDAQQAVIIRRLALDLDFPVRIEVVPTVRESDGLALSSRNTYLDQADRERALALSRALQLVEQMARAGTPLSDSLAAGRAELERSGIDLEYLEARDAESLAAASSLNGRPVLVAVAARVGETRLIDNIVIGGTEN